MNQKELIIRYHQEFKKLSARSQNILLDLELDNLKYFIKYYIYKKGGINFKKFRNVGNKTELELNQFIVNVLQGVEISITKPELEKEKRIEFDNKLELFFQIEFYKLKKRTQNVLSSINANCINNFYNEIIKSNKRSLGRYRNCGDKTIKEINEFKNKIFELIEHNKGNSVTSGLFSDINLYINQGKFFNSNMKEVFNHYYGFIQNKDKEILQKLANKLGLSRERVRQISKEIIPIIKKIINIIKQNPKYNMAKYYPNDYFIICEDFANNINKVENTKFTPGFITFALEEFNHPDFDCYIVKNKFPDYTGIFFKNNISFQVIKCLNRISELLTINKRKEDVIIEIDELLECYGHSQNKFNNKVVNNNNLFSRVQLIEIIKLLKKSSLIYQKNLKITPDHLIIKRTSKKLLYEYLIDVLNKYKKPMHFADIYTECKKEDITTESETSVHAALQHRPKIFGLKGPGIYGLKEWGGYFGKIGDVTEQILEDRGEPIDRRELEELLSRELYISQDSVKEVLFNYELENRFIKLKNNKVALKRWYKK